MNFIKFVQSFSSPFLDSFFQLVTMMGEETFFMVVVALVLWCINKEFGYRMGFAYVSSGIINLTLKEIFHIPRYIGADGIRSLRLETANGYAFPSGHTQLAASFWTSIMIQIKKNWLYGVGILAIILVALSRIYLGVHTLTDVLGGMIIGSTWVFGANRVFDYARKTEKNVIFLTFIIPMLVGTVYIGSDYYYKICGTVLGFLVGYLLETKYIRYEVNASPGKQIIKFLIGMSVLLILKSSVKALLPDTLLSHLFRYFLLALWVTAIAPYLFKQIFGQKPNFPSNTGKYIG